MTPVEPAAAAPPAELRALAEEAARQASAVAVARRGHGGALHVRLKDDGSEVSDADEAAQAAAIEFLAARRPQDGFIAEERLPAAIAAQRFAPGAPVWVIDPIDGTRNYLRGLPLFAASVGVMIAGRVVAGAVHAPLLDELWSASLGDGLRLNGVPFRREPAAREPRGRLIVGIPSMAEGPLAACTHAVLDRHLARNLGTTALHLAYLAAGRMSAVLVSDSKLWDIAAGFALLGATGGVLESLDGRPVFPLDVPGYRGEALPSAAAQDSHVLRAILRCATG